MSDRITSDLLKWAYCSGHEDCDCWHCRLVNQLDADAALLAEKDATIQTWKQEAEDWQQAAYTANKRAEVAEASVAEKDATIARLQEQLDGLMSGQYNAVVTHEEQP